MSKIICDVCGTSYPETATQCPICGCVRSGDPITVAGDTNEADVQPAATYTYVKGGRFSKANVKKRNAGKPVYNPEPAQDEQDESLNSKKTEKGLIIAVAVLLLAIVAVVIYIALNFFGVGLPFGGSGASENTTGTSQQTNQTTEQTETTVLEIPCESLKLSNSVVELDRVGEAFLLNVNVLPDDQTDDIAFVSEDDSVAAVDSNGKIVAIGAGQTVITVTCGDQTAQCRVVCNIQEETTAPTVPEVTYTEADFTFYNGNAAVKDLSFPLSDKTFKLYTGKIPAELITWETDDEGVAIFVDGLLTFVGTGVANVKVTYGDLTYECIIRVY